MMRWIKNSKKGMAVLGAVAFMLVAGWQFGVGGTEAVFSETEVALENAIEGSGNEDCKWKPIDCGGWGGGSYEACLVNGDGFQCTCGAVTREC